MHHFFTINQSDANTSARAGVLHTDHGDISTPCFMPIGTYGAIKTQSSAEIIDLPSQILLSNTDFFGLGITWYANDFHAIQ